MTITIVAQNGQSPQQAVQQVLQRVQEKMESSGRLIQDSLLWTVRNHFQTIYPGSKHYSPEHVQPAGFTRGANASGSIDIDVPGVTRAYHDMDIRPRWRKALTIPIVRQAYGKRAADFSDLFVVKNRRTGHSFLAQRQGGITTYLFLLVKRVFQRQDPELMPSDQTLCDNVFARLRAYLGN